MSAPLVTLCKRRNGRGYDVSRVLQTPRGYYIERFPADFKLSVTDQRSAAVAANVGRRVKGCPSVVGSFLTLEVV